MEVNVEKLRTGLKLIQAAVPKKPKLEILTSIRLGEGKLIATNLDTAITISGISGINDEPICLPYKNLVGFLASVPGNQSLGIIRDDGMAKLLSGFSSASFSSRPAVDFPPIPNPDPEHVTAVDGDALLRALTGVEFCCAADDDKRPVLQGVSLTLGETPEAAACDGYRLAWEPLNFKLPGEGQLIIPKEAVHALASLWKQAPKSPSPEGQSLADLARAKRLLKLSYSLESRTLKVDFGQASFITTLTAGTYPNYRQLVPQTFNSTVTFNAEDLWRALKGMSGVALEGSSIIRLEWGEGVIKAFTRADHGDISASLHATYTAPGRTAFNFKYLMAYLKDKTDNAALSILDRKSIGLFGYHGVARFCLMPMFVKWEDDPPDPPPAPQAEVTEPQDTDPGEPTDAEVEEAVTDNPDELTE